MGKRKSKVTIKHWPLGHALLTERAETALKREGRHRQLLVSILRRKAEQARLDQACARLVDAIAAGGELAALVAALKQKDGQRAEATARLADAKRRKSAGRSSVAELEDQIWKAAKDWRAALNGHRAEARPMIQAMLETKVNFTPTEPKRWTLAGKATTLFEGIEPEAMASPEGFEPSLPA